MTSTRRRWSSGELETLRELWPSEHPKAIAERLGRTVTAVQSKACKLRLRTSRHHASGTPKWAAEDNELLRRAYGKFSTAQISKDLGRSVDAVYAQASRLGLKASRGRGRAWTEKDDAQLYWLWGEASVKSIAKKLNRTPYAVIGRAKRLKLRAPSSGALTITDLSRQTGYGYQRIKNVMRRLGMTIRRAYTQEIGTRPRKGTRTSLSESQVERILEFLATYPDGKRLSVSAEGAWGLPIRGSRKPERCVVCDSNERPHVARGMCQRCYWADRARARRLKQARQRLTETLQARCLEE